MHGKDLNAPQWVPWADLGSLQFSTLSSPLQPPSLSSYRPGSVSCLLEMIRVTGSQCSVLSQVVVYDCKFMIILRMTLPIKLSLIMQTDCRGILKKLDTERNTLNFNHSDSQHIEYKHFFSNYLLTNRSFVFSWNYLEKFSELICIGWIEREFPKIIQIWKLKKWLLVVVIVLCDDTK